MFIGSFLFHPMIVSNAAMLLYVLQMNSESYASGSVAGNNVPEGIRAGICYPRSMSVTVTSGVTWGIIINCQVWRKLALLRLLGYLLIFIRI